MAIGLNLTTYQKKVFDEVMKSANIKTTTHTGMPDITAENYDLIIDAVSGAYFKKDMEGNSTDAEHLRIINERLAKMPFEKAAVEAIEEVETKETEVQETFDYMGVIPVENVPKRSYNRKSKVKNEEEANDE